MLVCCPINMKISDIAKKVGLPIKELRDKAKEFGFAIASKSNTMSDKKAKEFMDLLNQQKNGETEEQKNGETEEQKNIETEETQKKIINIPDVISVKDFSSRLDIPVVRVITELMKNGVMASINENIDFETAAIIGESFDVSIEKETKEKTTVEKRDNGGGTKQSRPPVVAIMGHVDHGKTTLLDYIRKSDIAGGESGGITQHIGAYQVEKKSRKITFLDTPGHAAFSAMREHGARITDIAVLVVAADDGVKPQTKESINFAKDAGVPIIIAINKIDMPGANIDKTKGELAELGLVSEEWGGTNIIVPVSAKSGEGVDTLLDMILLLADMKNIESFVDVPANGFVIESHLSHSKGPLATVLIRDGVLKIGDAFTIGRSVYGKVRMMTNYKGKKIKEAGPSDPVRIAGLSGLPNFGEVLEVEENPGDAKMKIAKLQKESYFKGIRPKSSLAQVSSAIMSGEMKELRLVIKADVSGSLQAIKDALGKLSFVEAKVKIISDGVGEISESDVKMAAASEALIIGFRVDVGVNSKKLIEKTGVAVETFSVIYELMDSINLTLSGLLKPEEVDTETGRGSILKIFKDSKKDKILGIRITEGEFNKGSKIDIYHDGVMLATGKIVTMKRGDEDITEAKKGIECGLGIVLRDIGEEKIKIAENDSVVVLKKEIQQKELTKG